MRKHLISLIDTMNRLSISKQAAILRAITEEVSIRGAARLVGVSKTTVLKLLVEVGTFCERYQDKHLRNLPCKRIEADEIWAFVGAKERNAQQESHGDIWTFTAICADSKLAVAWLVGYRDADYATAFMHDVAQRLKNRVQLTTDGHGMYLPAVAEAFHYDVDFAQLVKKYGADPNGDHRRYSPAVCNGADKKWIMGKPLAEHVSTSYVERQNLTMRMMSRRFTRLTNGFSKKVANHAHAVALHFFVYNFCKPHQTLTKRAKGIKATPAMAAGLTDRVWKVEEMLEMIYGKSN